MEPSTSPDRIQGTLNSLQMPALKRAVLDLTGQPWLPSANLDGASPSQIVELENVLDQSIREEGLSFIHVGRNRFEIVSAEEALEYRSERLLAEEVRLRSPRPQPESIATAALSNCVVFAGRSSYLLGRNICQSLGISPGALLSSEFANGETRIVIEQSVRDRDVFIVQTIAAPVNDSLMELCLAADALKRASARSITAVMPYYGYSRQEKKEHVRGPISARVVADMVETAGIHRVVSLDIHAEAIEGFFRIPFDNLAAFPLMVPHLAQKYGGERLVVVSPDAGGMPRAVAASNTLTRYLQKSAVTADQDALCPIRVEGMYKRRLKPNEVAEMHFIGDAESVRHATCILIDDMLDTGGSALKAARALKTYGAKAVVICATHPIFARGGLEKLRTAVSNDGRPVVDEIITTDSLPMRYAQGELVSVISVKPLLAEVIKRICSGQAASLRELEGFCGEAERGAV